MPINRTAKKIISTQVTKCLEYYFVVVTYDVNNCKDSNNQITKHSKTHKHPVELSHYFLTLT